MRSSVVRTLGIVKQSGASAGFSECSVHLPCGVCVAFFPSSRAILWRMDADFEFMRQAIEEARAAAAAGEVPIGAAMIQARIPRLVYGCDDPKGGAVRSCFEILSHPRLNHQVDVASGILAAECAALLQSFFAARR